MDAAVFAAFGGPDDVEMREVADPEPDDGEAIVRVEAASINHHDLWILEGAGAMGSDDAPFVSGVDLAGVVDEVGPGVSDVEVGDRVVLCPNLTCGTCRFCREGPENRCVEYSLYHGGFAERAAVETDRLLALPDSVDAVTAAALPVAYVTALHMLRQAEVGVGDIVLVPGATGGVGVAAVQLVDVFGGTAIGTTRSEEKGRKLEELGLEHVAVTDDVDEIATAVEGISEPDVGINHLSGPFTDACLSMVRRGGTVVSCGATAGGQSEIDVRGMYLAHKRLLGSTMGTQGDLERVLGLVADGRIDPVVDREFPLAELGDAFRAMQDRELFGKAVVVP